MFLSMRGLCCFFCVFCALLDVRAFNAWRIDTSVLLTRELRIEEVLPSPGSLLNGSVDVLPFVPIGPILLLDENGNVEEVILDGASPFEGVLAAVQHQVEQIDDLGDIVAPIFWEGRRHDVYGMVILLEAIQRRDLSDVSRERLEVLLHYVTEVLLWKIKYNAEIDAEGLEYFNCIRLFQLLLTCPYIGVSDQVALGDAMLELFSEEEVPNNWGHWLDGFNEAIESIALSDDQVRRLLIFIFNQLEYEGVRSQYMERFMRILGNALRYYSFSYGVQEAVIGQLKSLLVSQQFSVVHEIIRALSAAVQGSSLSLDLRNQALQAILSFHKGALLDFSWIHIPVLTRTLLVELAELVYSGSLEELEWHDAVNIIYGYSQSGYKHYKEISYGVISAWIKILQTKGINPYLRQGFLRKLIEFLKVEGRPTYVLEEGVAGLGHIAISPDASDAELDSIVDTLTLMLGALPELYEIMLKRMVVTLITVLDKGAGSDVLRLRAIALLTKIVQDYSESRFVQNALDAVRAELIECPKNRAEALALEFVFQALPKENM